MTGLLKSLAVKFIKGHWGRVIPAIFKAAGEGDFGPQVKAIYWFAEKYATITGMVFCFLAWGAKALAQQYPELAWATPFANGVMVASGVLAQAGLLRGATNSPWPDKARGDVRKELKAEAKIEKEAKEEK